MRRWPLARGPTQVIEAAHELDLIAMECGASAEPDGLRGLLGGLRARASLVAVVSRASFSALANDAQALLDVLRVNSQEPAQLTSAWCMVNDPRRARWVAREIASAKGDLHGFLAVLMEAQFVLEDLNHARAKMAFPDYWGFVSTLVAHGAVPALVADFGEKLALLRAHATDRAAALKLASARKGLANMAPTGACVKASRRVPSTATPALTG